MATPFEDQKARNREEHTAISRDESTQTPVAAEYLDALDLRLIDTFPASDATAQYCGLS